MSQPMGFKTAGKENMICKLNKSLYKLKQSPRQWCKRFNSFIREKRSDVHKLKKDLSSEFEMKDLS